jgi:hypothetical protein
LLLLLLLLLLQASWRSLLAQPAPDLFDKQNLLSSSASFRLPDAVLAAACCQVPGAWCCSAHEVVALHRQIRDWLA